MCLPCLLTLVVWNRNARVAPSNLGLSKVEGLFGGGEKSFVIASEAQPSTAISTPKSEIGNEPPLTRFKRYLLPSL